MVATLLFYVPSGSAAWAEQGTPSVAEESVKSELETPKSVMQDNVSEKHELDNRFRELEKAMSKQQRLTEAIDFGGAIEIEVFWERGFDDRETSKLELSTAEIDFEIQFYDWVMGSLTIGWDSDGDKFTADDAFITLHNAEKSPLYLIAGRTTAPFGVATVETVSDTPLSIEDPLTIEVFETTEDIVLLGLVASGFEVGAYGFSGNNNHVRQWGATVGYSAGNESWSFDSGIDLISNVWTSDGLSDAYEDPQSDYAYGIAAEIQALASDFSIVIEYNGALTKTKFEEDDESTNIRPRAWQVELGYFAELFEKNTVFSLGYSRSDDLGGEFAERRLLATVGIWILDDLRLKLEYNHDWDYSESDGGTGDILDKVTSQLTYEW
jgi:hypothetical protein